MSYTGYVISYIIMYQETFNTIKIVIYTSVADPRVTHLVRPSPSSSPTPTPKGPNSFVLTYKFYET